MPLRNRPYVPKIKGCYECSQRRIHCDRKEPVCGKCTAKGISCSGLGTRFRFRDASQRRSPRKHILPPTSCSKSRTGSDCLFQSPEEVLNILFPNECKNSPSSPKDVPALFLPSPQTSDSDRSPEPAMSPFDSISIITPPLAEFEAWKSYLLTYFSEQIAPQMVVIDDQHNGWRGTILPIAHTDELVLNSVLAVASLHLLGTVGSSPGCADPRRLYTQVIRGLQRRSDLGNCDMATKKSVILTILILLLAVMVTGGSDFPILFRMLQSAIDAVGGDGGLDEGEVSAFLLREIRKMRVNASPLISLDSGICAILSHGAQSFDCLRYYRTLHPRHALALDRIAEVRQQAYDIYLQRALARTGSPPRALSHLVDQFKQLLVLYPEVAQMDHVLVWSAFIIGLECRQTEDQRFFRRFLERQFRRNGFANIIRAMELLQQVWEGCAERNWAAELPQLQVFVT
ncbi:hypothetical protein BO86DRAFT_127228 [Aspergillus japonicus CBS 114.51]|uniref:Zn(2)-C6 fungal-type domain-containing protein n=2 Tax=Aspergillus TaxID=5052 RepID=A0A2V5I9F9_ASPV1|nr:hypothetical protein BO86DRAFT_127228 [Aspergillus japonicus CBS 114.51]PYI16246.1 hypothetical protein BO99DRAFT_483983 [Aspergillus violaceofuscus CBS 115571]RAH80532.1 hypothetical protein BO86DRAFT_127228 [Aspergillus japonicus CBS 114.51]